MPDANRVFDPIGVIYQIEDVPIQQTHSLGRFVVFQRRLAVVVKYAENVLQLFFASGNKELPQPFRRHRVKVGNRNCAIFHLNRMRLACAYAHKDVRRGRAEIDTHDRLTGVPWIVRRRRLEQQ